RPGSGANRGAGGPPPQGGPMFRSRRTRFILSMAVAASLGALVAGGGASALPRPGSPYPKLNIFTQGPSLLENSYIEDLDDEKLIHGAIKGMLATLDPHSAFLDPGQYREMKAEASGQFGGVGLEVELREGILTVMSAIEGTPAARAGMQTGDQLLRI